MVPDKKYYERWKRIWVDELKKESLPETEKEKIRQKINTIDIKLNMIDSGHIPGSSMRTRVVITDKSLDDIESSHKIQSEILRAFNLSGNFPIFKRDYITVIINKNRVEFYYGPRLALIYETNLNIEDMQKGFNELSRIKNESVNYKQQLLSVMNELRITMPDLPIYYIYNIFSTVNKKMDPRYKYAIFSMALMALVNDKAIMLISKVGEKTYWFPNDMTYTNVVLSVMPTIILRKIDIAEMLSKLRRVQLSGNRLTKILSKVYDYTGASSSALIILNIQKYTSLIENKLGTLENALNEYAMTMNTMELNIKNRAILNDVYMSLLNKNNQMALIVDKAIIDLKREKKLKPTMYETLFKLYNDIKVILDDTKRDLTSILESIK